MTKDIYITDPLGLSIEILETEEKHPPSFRCEFSVHFETMNSHICYSATDTWIEYSVFDSFLMNLQELSVGGKISAELFDMSREIFYQVSTEKISVSINRSLGVTSTGNLEFQFDVDGSNCNPQRPYRKIPQMVVEVRCLTMPCTPSGLTAPFF